MKRLILLPALLMLAGLAVSVPLATSASGDATCPPATSASHDLIVPAGQTCILSSASTIGHDLIVQKGGRLEDHGATIGHDIVATDSPGEIAIDSGGSVGHDIRVDGTTGVNAVYMSDYICRTTIGHDVTVTGSTATGGPWYIGDSDGQPPAPASICGAGISVQHDLTVKNNATRMDVSENGTNPFAPGVGGIGHDLTVANNASQTVEGNVVSHDATCNPAQTAADKDGDATPNQAGHNNNGCG